MHFKMFFLRSALLMGLPLLLLAMAKFYSMLGRNHGHGRIAYVCWCNCLERMQKAGLFCYKDRTR